jgi:xanthine dehydrogenase large subunit
MAGQLRLQRRPVRAGGRPRGLPLRQRLLPQRCGHRPPTAASTNTQSHTAFRGFGGPQGVIAIETILGDIARHLGLDPLCGAPAQPVRQRRLATGSAMSRTTRWQVEDNIAAAAARANGSSRPDATTARGARQAIAAWNANHPVLKRGIGDHAGEVRHLVHRDPVQPGRRSGACLSPTAAWMVNHGGTEMGQGLHTKVCPDRGRRAGRAASSACWITASDTSARAQCHQPPPPPAAPT